MSRHARQCPPVMAALRRAVPPTVADRLAGLYRIGLEHRARLEADREALTDEIRRLRTELIRTRAELRELRSSPPTAPTPVIEIGSGEQGAVAGLSRRLAPNRQDADELLTALGLAPEQEADR